MSDLVGNPKDRFSGEAAPLFSGFDISISQAVHNMGESHSI